MKCISGTPFPNNISFEKHFILNVKWWVTIRGISVGFDYKKLPPFPKLGHCVVYKKSSILFNEVSDTMKKLITDYKVVTA